MAGSEGALPICERGEKEATAAAAASVLAGAAAELALRCAVCRSEKAVDGSFRFESGTGASARAMLTRTSWSRGGDRSCFPTPQLPEAMGAVAVDCAHRTLPLPTPPTTSPSSTMRNFTTRSSTRRVFTPQSASP
eukprot:2330136-Pleurochrysis_carterae.AAC.2